MSKVRIYDLSKELNLENKDILTICSQLGVAAKSHSSTISEEDAASIRAAAGSYKSTTAPTAPSPSVPKPPNNTESLNKPKKQQILQVRRSPDAPNAKPKRPDAGAPAAVKKAPARPAAAAPSGQVAPPAPSAPPVAPKPLASPPPRTEPAAKAAATKQTVAKPVAPPPRPVLNKPPAIVKKAASAETAAPAKPAKPTKPTPGQKPTPRPQQIVELRRPKPVSETAKPTPISNKPQRPSVAKAGGDGAEATPPNKPVAPAAALMAKPTMPSRNRPRKPWQEEEDTDALEKAKAANAKKRRGPKFQEADLEMDDDLLDDDDEDATVSREQMSLSLARPPKPKSMQTAKPVAATTQRRRPSMGGNKKNSYRDRRDRRHQQANQKQERPEIITLTRGMTVQELSQLMSVSETEIIRSLFIKGIAATVTQTLDVDTATKVAEEMGILVDHVEEQSAATKVTEMLDADDLENLHRRPPVVTIMGHVDHGKTSLLDAIRKTKVASGEAGGITQHIGAYHVDVDHNGATQQVVFLDTPGHEAFTAMRARGARVTDVAILVVAADDGVQPQTIEAISHAKAAGVPMIVAINKVDKEDSQPDRVKQELTEHGLVPEEWGGDAVMVPVSAITGQNLDTLLDMILLVTEVEDLNANPNRLAKGTVIEAHLDKAKGPVATLLVQNGTLHVGDILVAGSALGKVRAMVDDRGQRVKQASPSYAVEVLGLSDVPAAGDEFDVYNDEKEARSIATGRADEQRQSRLMAAISSRRVSLNTLSSKAQEGDLKELNIVMKADVQGSVEAILGSLKQLPQGEVQVRVLFAAPGEISETDVDLAAASEAVLIGFNTTLAPGARQSADRLGVDVREYNIIYALLDDIQAAMEGLLEPELVEESLGSIEVRAVFSVGKGAVAGCYIQNGKAIRNCKVRVRRKDEVVFEGGLDSLKRMREDVREVNSGYECGVGIDNFNAWQEGDIIETYRMVTKRRTLSMSK
ncbi:translation initiation factor IF-2 [filamentous cyanobacterium LEGE 11480]|uniref:Translation initiation factor IF-2 n=1 Tax=Romeriopsis navalis LEGE 11480 TaxID=2777977 RepID=A0A928Z1S6_9CYAN|nr:translation initiation factor IF-2 [Romeriopsis navalis]MBE9029656.1 translation initiation factor IF-2 [Romeriopsis navalis LEGE 11480]